MDEKRLDEIERDLRIRVYQDSMNFHVPELIAEVRRLQALLAAQNMRVAGSGKTLWTERPKAALSLVPPNLQDGTWHPAGIQNVYINDSGAMYEIVPEGAEPHPDYTQF